MQSSSYSLDNEHSQSWNLLETLEGELEKTRAFIDIHPDNYQSFSDYYKNIIVQACEEIEAIYQRISGKVLEAQSNISHYIAAITSHCANFFHHEVTMPEHNTVLKPWNSCIEGKNPSFWAAYTSIKHQGLSEKATLEHAIYAMAALFSLLLAWH